MPRFTFRPDTIDFEIFNMVYFQNEYQLPERFAPDDIILDIGAHIGSFAYAVWVRGARQIISVEAHPQNYGFACVHLQEFISCGDLDLRWGAVWRSDTDDDNLSIHDFPIIDGQTINTGEVAVTLAGNNQPIIPKVALDDLIGEHPIRLLKLDCEGAEFPILLTSRQLHHVQEIVGEFHEAGGAYDDRRPIFNLPYYDRFTVDVLRDHLERAGFQTTIDRHQRYQNDQWIPQPLGYFRAKRLT